VRETLLVSLVYARPTFFYALFHLAGPPFFFHISFSLHPSRSSTAPNTQSVVCRFSQHAARIPCAYAFSSLLLFTRISFCFPLRCCTKMSSFHLVFFCSSLLSRRFFLLLPLNIYSLSRLKESFSPSSVYPSVAQRRSQRWGREAPPSLSCSSSLSLPLVCSFCSLS
jgi:hypothetical protein